MNFIRNQNVQAIFLTVISIAETVMLSLFKPIPLELIIGLQLISLLAIVSIRFAYSIALLGNKWHSFWRRKYSSDGDDEPSDFAVGAIKVTGYFLILCSLIPLFL